MCHFLDRNITEMKNECQEISQRFVQRTSCMQIACSCVCVLACGISVNEEKQLALIKTTVTWSHPDFRHSQLNKARVYVHVDTGAKSGLTHIGSPVMKMQKECLPIIWDLSHTHTHTQIILCIHPQNTTLCLLLVSGCQITIPYPNRWQWRSLLAAYVTCLLFIEMKQSLHPFVPSKSINNTYLVFCAHKGMHTQWVHMDG